MNVKDIMSRNIIHCDINDDVKDVSNLMKDNNIGFIVVYKKNKLYGCLTDRDIAINYGNSIKDITKTNLYTINEEESLLNTAKIMAKNKIKRVIVTNQNNISGIVSLSDLIKYIDCYEEIKQIYSINNNNTKINVKVNDFNL